MTRMTIPTFRPRCPSVKKWVGKRQLAREEESLRRCSSKLWEKGGGGGRKKRGKNVEDEKKGRGFL